MSLKSGSKMKVPVGTTQVTSSDRTNSFKCSQSPAVAKQTSAAKQVPESKQPIVESKWSSNTKRGVVPKQSNSTRATASGSKIATIPSTGTGASKPVIKTKPPAEDYNKSLARELEVLKALVADQAARLEKLEEERDQTSAPPIDDDDPGSLSVSEDDEPELIHKPDPLGNLQVAMGLSDKKRLYNRCRANVALAMLQEHVPLNVDWRNQRWSTVCKAAERAKELEPHLHKYADDWATYEIMKTIAKNKRSYNVKRVRGYTAPGGKSSSGDQVEPSGLGDVSVRVGSNGASSHNGDNENNDIGELNDSGTEDEDRCDCNDLEAQEDEDCCDCNDVEVQEDDDSEIGESGAHGDEGSEVGNSEMKGDDDSEGSEPDSQEVDDSETGDVDPSDYGHEIGGSDIKVEEDTEDGNERCWRMEVVNDDHMVDADEKVVDSRKDMTRKGLKRRLTKDLELREDNGAAQMADKLTTKRKKK